MHSARKDNFSNNERDGQINQIGEGWLESSMLAPMAGIHHVLTQFPPSMDTGNVWHPVVPSVPVVTRP